jgi:hypothetical protein
LGTVSKLHPMHIIHPHAHHDYVKLAGKLACEDGSGRSSGLGSLRARTEIETAQRAGPGALVTRERQRPRAPGRRGPSGRAHTAHVAARSFIVFSWSYVRSAGAPYGRRPPSPVVAPSTVARDGRQVRRAGNKGAAQPRAPGPQDPGVPLPHAAPSFTPTDAPDSHT